MQEFDTSIVAEFLKPGVGKTEENIIKCYLKYAELMRNRDENGLKQVHEKLKQRREKKDSEEMGWFSES